MVILLTGHPIAPLEIDLDNLADVHPVKIKVKTNNKANNFT